MGYRKTILCLAASRKPDGQCIAGKEIRKRGFGSWIRPISGRESESISSSDSEYDKDGVAELLDKIQIEFKEPRPDSFQSENHLIDDGFYWEKTGTATWEELENALDPIPEPLWVDGRSTWHGHNDKIPKIETAGLTTSLLLVRPTDLKISVGMETQYRGEPKRHVRASFRLGKTAYKLMITDPVMERIYKRKGDGSYPIEESIICISLAKIYHGNAIKLVAAVITPERAG